MSGTSLDGIDASLVDLKTIKFSINVEAIVFAWLARQTLNNLPDNLKEVIGASKAVVLYQGKTKASD